MPDDNGKKYAAVPEKVTVPVEPELKTPTRAKAPDRTAHPDLGTSVPEELPRAPKAP